MTADSCYTTVSSNPAGQTASRQYLTYGFKTIPACITTGQTEVAVGGWWACKPQDCVWLCLNNMNTFVKLGERLWAQVHINKVPLQTISDHDQSLFLTLTKSCKCLNITTRGVFMLLLLLVVMKYIAICQICLFTTFPHYVDKNVIRRAFNFLQNILAKANESNRNGVSRRQGCPHDPCDCINVQFVFIIVAFPQNMDNIDKFIRMDMSHYAKYIDRVVNQRGSYSTDH